MAETENDTAEMLITLTADIVAAHVSNNSPQVAEVSLLVSTVHAALAGLRQPVAVQEESLIPAVSVRASVKRDHLICLEDGKHMKMLKRHLMTEHGMTPADYRERWALSADYPMVAPAYAETRRDLAIKIGLGRKPGQRRGRRKKLPS